MTLNKLLPPSITTASEAPPQTDKIYGFSKVVFVNRGRLRPQQCERAEALFLVGPQCDPYPRNRGNAMTGAYYDYTAFSHYHSQGSCNS